MRSVKNLFTSGSKQPLVQGDTPLTRSDKIRAFHSILAMLAQLQQDEPIKTGDVLSVRAPTPSERRQLKLSNAFAHLAVTDNEVVAVTLYDPEGLAVMTWMQDDAQDKPEDAQGALKPTLWDRMFWVFTTNTRHPDHLPDSDYRKECPRIVDATPPPGYPTAGDPKTNLLEYLNKFLKNW
jgi:hypothetical protein